MHGKCWLIGILLTLLAACMVPSAKQNNSAQTITYTPMKTNVRPTPRFKLEKPSVLDETENENTPNQQPAPANSPDKTVRVLILENSKSAYVKHAGRVNIYTQDKSKKYKISQAGTLSIKPHKNGQVQVGTLVASQPIFIEPVNGITLTLDKNGYTGIFKVVPNASTFNIIELTPLENYLYGVLPHEMHHTWALEALKAQAVAARTYTLKSIENKSEEPFDLYNDVRSQVYKGSAQVYDSVKQAVDKTRGQVLSYKGELFYTYYHGNCGGGTDHVEIWNEKAPHIKPLAGASCKFDTHSKSYNFSQDIAKSAAEKFARLQGLKGTLSSIKVSKKTATGRANLLTLKTNNGSKQVRCADFRVATGIRSCKITKLTTGTTKIHVEGHGYGHGIGMCQDGAHGMAKQNYTYKQILKQYYPGSTLAVVR